MQSITCALTRTPTSDPVHLGFPDDSSNPDETTVFDRAALLAWFDAHIGDAGCVFPVTGGLCTPAELSIHDVTSAEVLAISTTVARLQAPPLHSGPIPVVVSAENLSIRLSSGEL